MSDRLRPKCQIRWIDSEGKPTPDDNDAVGVVYRPGFYEQWRGDVLEYPTTDPLFICAEHAKRCQGPGHDQAIRGRWVFIPLPASELKRSS